MSSVDAINCGRYELGDNYELNNPHVLPALIRKMHVAKVADAKQVVLRGSSTPKRELLVMPAEDKELRISNVGSPQTLLLAPSILSH